MIDDAKRWLAESDKTKALGDEKMGWVSEGVLRLQHRVAALRARSDLGAERDAYAHGRVDAQEHSRPAPARRAALRSLRGSRALDAVGLGAAQTSAASPSVEGCSLERRVELEGIE
jgi:hypothetical protein